MKFWPPAPPPPWHLNPLVPDQATNSGQLWWAPLFLALITCVALAISVTYWLILRRQPASDPGKTLELEIRTRLLHFIGPKARWITSHELARLIPAFQPADQTTMLNLQQALARLEHQRFAPTHHPAPAAHSPHNSPAM